MESRCNLIIDSCSDLPIELAEREGVSLIEFTYVMSDGEHKDDLYQSRSAHDFYRAMRDGEEPTTAALTIGTLEAAFLQAMETGVPTVFLCFSSGLSGSYDTAVLTRDRLLKEHPGAELYVVDTRLAAAAEGLLVHEAIRQRDKGMNARELAEWATEARNFVVAEFMVEDLECLRRGGRISSTVAYAGSKLDVKPLLTIDLDGKLTLKGVARGRKKGLKQLVDAFEKKAIRSGVGRHAFIAHADCPKDVERLKGEIEKIDSEILILESEVGPVIGSHVGPGMIALIFWGSDRREDISVADRIASRIKGSR